MTTANPFARPLYVMAKPVGAQCNLDCAYCYYKEKERFYDSKRAKMMSDATLQNFVKQYISAQTTDSVLFTWHGGEPLLRPLSFYKRAVELQRLYAHGKHIDNSLQTNGVLLNDDWCKFLAENNWLVGISIDGPQDIHDSYRRSIGGQPTWERVMRAIERLDRWGVEWNAMAVVTQLTTQDPLRFYNFFKSIGCHYIQLSPVVERLATTEHGTRLTLPNEQGALPVAPYSVRPDDWGRLLCDIFDEWVKKDVGQYFVEIFDCTLANWVGTAPGICIYAKECGHAGVMEFNGDVYSCDHYVFPEHKLGNIHRESLVQMLHGERQHAFGRAKEALLTRQCRECPYLFACNGECPKNRFATDRYGNPGHNYLCAGYQRFFHHVAPYMDFMRQELMAGRAPANVMSFRP